MTTPRNARQPIVWVMPPVVGADNRATFPWDWSTWTREPRLDLLTSAKNKNGDGQATFGLLRRFQYPEGGPDFALQPSNFRAGCYVLISTSSVIDDADPANPVELPDIESVDWFGVLNEVEFEIADTGDYIGTVTAVEVGASILDSQRVTGFAQDNGGGEPEALLTAPTANLNGGDNLVIGNAKLGQDADGNPAYLFARELADCGNNPIDDPDLYWTCWRLATHIATFCRPDGLPKIVVRLEDGSGVSGDLYSFSGHAVGTLADYLDDASKPEVSELFGLTFKGMFDLIAGAGVGLGSRVELAEVGSEVVWQITIYSRSELNAPYGPPKKEPNPTGPRVLSTSYVASDEYTVDLSFSEDDTAAYDEVIVEGARIVFGVSLSPLDDNLNRAWSDAEEDAYNAAQPAARDLPTFTGIYSSFVLARSGGVLVRATNPGTNDSSLPLLPHIYWDGSLASVSSDQTVANLPGLRFTSFVPWIDRFDPETGNTDAELAVKASPSYMRPRVFNFDEDDTSKPWVDLLTRTVSPTFTPISESPSIDMDERRPGIKIAYSRPHILGLDSFDGTDDGGGTPTYDWRDLVVTVGIASDQRVMVTRRRTVDGVEIADDQVRRRLPVQDENLNCWVCLAGTVVGVSDDNSDAVRVAADKFLVNDFPAAQAWCDQLAEWAFRPHESAVIVHNNEEGTRIWKIGMSLYQVVDGSTTRRISGVIASLETNWKAGTVTLRTETPPAPPGRGGGQSASPSQGGAVSAELGGTLAQVVQQQGAKLKKVAADAAKKALIPAVAGGGSVAVPPWHYVTGAIPLPGLGSIGIAKRSDAVAGSEFAVPPVTGTGIVQVPADTYPVASLPAAGGVGIGRHWQTGAFVFLLLDSTSSYASEVPLSARVYAPTSIDLTLVSGGANYVFRCYQIVGAF